MDFDLQLLRHVAAHPDDRRLEPLVLRCLQQLQQSQRGQTVRNLRVVYKEDGSAEVYDLRPRVSALVCWLSSSVIEGHELHRDAAV